MAVIGIDLGFQNSLVAAPSAGGIDVLLNDYSQRKTATMVCFGDKQREIGESARAKAVTRYQNTICNFEPFIGRRYNDPDVQEELKRTLYKTTAMQDGSVGVVVQHLGKEMVFSIVQLTGMMLRKLKDIAEASLKTKVVDCVLGVPVFFNDEQRHAMLAACKIAGLNCLRLFNETSAVALGYGIYKQDLPAENEKPRRVVFCDLGHATLQLSVCEFVKGKANIICTSYDPHIGGRNFDEVIFDQLVTEFKDKYKLDVRSNVRAAGKLLLECEKLKQSMSANSTMLPLNIECFMDDKDVSARMCREQFEKLAIPVLQKIEIACHKLVEALKNASDNKLGVADIDEVEIVGGTVRIPAVKNILQTVFGREPRTTLNLDEIVAKGCALEAAIVSPNFRVREFEIVDKTPYGITLHWQATGGAEEAASNAELFKAHAPAHLTKVLTFFRDKDCEFYAKYTDPQQVLGNVSDIATYKLSGIVPSYDGESQKIKVKVHLDTHGIFHIPEATLVEKVPPESISDAAPNTADSTSQPMDTSQDAAGTESPKKEQEAGAPSPDKKDEPAKKKLKTHKNTPLVVAETKPWVLSAKNCDELTERENELYSQDRKEIEKSNAKNALEEYIYFLRDKSCDETYTVFIKESDREKLSAQLTQLEDWLYSDGADGEKSVYQAKLTEIKAVGDPMLSRKQEADARPGAEENFRKSVVVIRKFLDQHAQGDEQFAHISAEDVAKVQKELSEKEAWLNSQMSAQAKLLPYEPPVVSASKIEAERDVMDKFCTPIMRKPKPKVEPPKEAPKAEAQGQNQPQKPNAAPDASPAPDAPPTTEDGKQGSNMDLD